MVDVPTVSIVIAATSVVAGVVYYAFQIRHQTRMRQMDLLMRLYLAWGDEGMKKAFGVVLGLEIKDYEEFVRKYGPVAGKRSPVSNAVDRVGWFLNGIGFLVYEKFADIKLIDDLFGYGVIVIWEKIKPAVYGWRKEFHIPKSFQWLEYLANEMKKREQRGVKSD